MLGFPIRKSSDQRSVDSSPRHIAASHVLHRLSMPRHPPCALRHLLTQKPKNKNYTKRTRRHYEQRIHLDARNHYPVLKHHTPPPRWGDKHSNDPSVASGPNSVSGNRLLLRTRPPPTTGENPSRPAPTQCGNPLVVLLRKEVIQPHLPVRLPCYDFVPIADPTFDSSLPKG